MSLGHLSLGDVLHSCSIAYAVARPPSIGMWLISGLDSLDLSKKLTARLLPLGVDQWRLKRPRPAVC